MCVFFYTSPISFWTFRTHSVQCLAEERTLPWKKNKKPAPTERLQRLAAGIQRANTLKPLEIMATM